MAQWNMTGPKQSGGVAGIVGLAVGVEGARGISELLGPEDEAPRRLQVVGRGLYVGDVEGGEGAEVAHAEVVGGHEHEELAAIA